MLALKRFACFKFKYCTVGSVWDELRIIYLFKFKLKEKSVGHKIIHKVISGKVK